MRTLMMKTRIGVAIAALTVVGMCGETHAQLSGPPAVEPVAGPDTRVALGLTLTTREALKATMRKHLEAIEMIVRALSQADYDKAAGIAHAELGFPKHHEAMQREQGATFPPKYQELAMAHHQAAEDLAEAIPTKEMKLILEKLDQTMKACVACHQAYKL